MTVAHVQHYSSGTEFMEGMGEHVPPNCWTGEDIISFVPLNILW